jgi:PIN domain nuclease of toxin-antitoxin system
VSDRRPAGFLLDTHTFLWMASEPDRLGSAARAQIDDASTELPWHQRDPFDRLLVAQANSGGLAIISRDAAFDAYQVERIW